MTHYHHFIKIILQQTITFILTILDLHQICVSIAPSAEYGRTQRDLARARPFLGPYFLYIIKKNSCVHLPYSADWSIAAEQTMENVWKNLPADLKESDSYRKCKKSLKAYFHHELFLSGP